MALCKFCGKVFQWGRMEDGWVPLVPIAEHEGLDRTHQDENGVLRADHRLLCTSRGGPAVTVVKLARKVSADDVLPLPGVTHSNEALAIPRQRRSSRLGQKLDDGFTIFKKRKPRKERS